MTIPFWLAVTWCVSALIAAVWLTQNRSEMVAVGVLDEARSLQDTVLDIAVLVIGMFAGPLTVLTLAAIWWAGRK